MLQVIHFYLINQHPLSAYSAATGKPNPATSATTVAPLAAPATVPPLKVPLSAALHAKSVAPSSVKPRQPSTSRKFASASSF